jgi:hypothetical protein
MTRRKTGLSLSASVFQAGCPLLREVEMSRRLTAIIQAEGTGYVSLCPELDIASQGDTIEEARDNLRAKNRCQFILNVEI